MPVIAAADIIWDVPVQEAAAESKAPRPVARLRDHLPRSHRAADLLQNDWGIGGRPLGCLSFTELAATARTSPAGTCSTRSKPEADRTSNRCLADAEGSGRRRDRLHRMLFAEQIRPFVNRRYVTLGTDGFAAPTPARNCATISRWIATG